MPKPVAQSKSAAAGGAQPHPRTRNERSSHPAVSSHPSRASARKGAYTADETHAPDPHRAEVMPHAKEEHQRQDRRRNLLGTHPRPSRSYPPRPRSLPPPLRNRG